MKRDMELVRAILLEIESTPPNEVYSISDSTIDSHDRDTVRAHLELLDEAGLVAVFHKDRSGTCCRGLTWQGHDFLDAARSQTVWKQAKERLKQTGLAVSFDVLTSLLSSIAREQLGIGQ